AQHHEVAGLLANSGGTAPAGVWTGIAEQLGGTSDQAWGRLAARLDPPGAGRAADSTDITVTTTADITTVGAGDAALAPVVPLGAGVRRRRRWAMAGSGLVAGAAAVLALVFGLQVHHLNGQVDALRAAPQLSAAERAALASPSTRRVPLASTASTGARSTPATIVLTAAGTGFLVNDSTGGLSPLPAGRTYQLWGVVGGRAISLGLLGPHPGIVPFSAAGTAPVTEFAVTDEVAGGVVRSANRPVAVGSVRV
ncbi:MAG TPA: anti-sigma factor, partial [Acidimicrobiales bacterium]|nr:anti-sigma factor [Acidimicrobiales bacterium]